jgi:uncharacterized protein YecE (DUF72 family)
VPVLIGTSGWQYRHWAARLYRGVPQKRWLEHYAERFATVEVNASFYRLPARETFAAWGERTPDDLVFAVKASRYLTHIRRLREPEEAVGRLVEAARGLGPKLGPILVQLPPDMRRELGRLEETLAAFPSGLRIAVEPRHDSWFGPDLERLLERYDAALCMADRPRWRPRPWRTASWGYLRMHEGRAAPRPCYGRAALDGWARRLAALFDAGEDVYVYFNNDPEGCAVRDARRLALRLEAAGLPATRAPGPRETPVGA